MMGLRFRLAVVIPLLCALLLAAPPTMLAQDVPDGFSDGEFADVDLPTALDFLPNNDLLVTSKPGILVHVTSDGSITGPALDLSAVTCDESERGLLGVAVDPDFDENNSIYLFYTFRKSRDSCVNRVSRFEFDGAAVVPGSERKLLNNMPATNGNHNGGDLQFGNDGHLYVSIGEAGVAANAQQRNLLSGKILRITADGKIPPGNPFTGRRTDRCHETGRTSAKRTCREIFALGLRNPFRIAHDPNAEGTRFFINDVGDQR